MWALIKYRYQYDYTCEHMTTNVGTGPNGPKGPVTTNVGRKMNLNVRSTFSPMPFEFHENLGFTGPPKFYIVLSFLKIRGTPEFFQCPSFPEGHENLGWHAPSELSRRPVFLRVSLDVVLDTTMNVGINVMWVSI